MYRRKFKSRMLRLTHSKICNNSKLKKTTHMSTIDETIAKNNLFFRQMLFLAVLILIGAVIIGKLSFLIGSLLGALTLYVVFRPWQFAMVNKYRWKPWLASLLFVSIAIIVLAGLIFGVFRVVASELINLNFSNILAGMDNIVADINKHLPFNLIPDNYLAEYSSYLGKAAGSIINTTYSFVINIFFMIIILYFMLAKAQAMERTIGRYSPFKGTSKDMVVKEVSSIIYSNAIGIPIIMLGQGLSAALIYWLFGIQHVAFWAFLTAVAGLIPVVGSVIVSVPLGISFIINGAIWQGILLMACGILIIANVDNLLRIILNRKMTDTHPLIVIFGVLMGIPLFGFWGIIFGPLLISIFLLLIKIYYMEFRLISPQELAAEESEADARKRRKPHLPSRLIRETTKARRKPEGNE